MAQQYCIHCPTDVLLVTLVAVLALGCGSGGTGGVTGSGGTRAGGAAVGGATATGGAVATGGAKASSGHRDRVGHGLRQARCLLRYFLQLFGERQSQ